MRGADILDLAANPAVRLAVATTAMYPPRIRAAHGRLAARRSTPARSANQELICSSLAGRQARRGLLRLLFDFPAKAFI